jgi:CPA2 family monovalent cation:H+ antiporter-2
MIGFFAGTLLGWSFFDSLFLGAALSISSTTIIIKAIEELKLKGQHFAEMIFGILILEDLLAILLLVGLSTFVAYEEILSGAIVWAFIKLILVIGSWFLAGYFLIPPIFNRIKNYINDETLVLITVALCLFLVIVAYHFNYSGALGAFIMGSILSETALVHRITHLIKPIRDVFAAVFFVSIGMLFDPHIIALYWPTILIICTVTIIGKICVTGVSSFLSGQRFTDAVQIGFGMAQIGEFSFIIIGVGLILGVISPELFPIIISISAITTFSTPYLIRFSHKFSNKIYQWLPNVMQKALEKYSENLQSLLGNAKQESLYRNAGMRLIVNAVIVAVIFTLTENFILPEMVTYVEATWLEKGMAWLIALVFASPFIWGMLGAFRGKQLNPSALYFSWAITALELAVLSVAYFERWLLSLGFFIGAVILFKLFYKQLDKSYHWFENHLTQNLQDKTIHEQESATAYGEVVEVEVTLDSALLGTKMSPQELASHYDVNVIGVVHNEKITWINLQEKNILPRDRLILMGTKEKINEFIAKFNLHIS